MKLGIQSRLSWWLAVIILLIAGTTIVAVNYIETSLINRHHAELANASRLEASRIEQSLAQYRSRVEHLVASADFGQVGSLPTAIGDERGVGWPLQDVQDWMLRNSRSVNGSIRALTILGADSTVLATTEGVTYGVPPQALIAKALFSGRAEFGEAFRVADRDDRLLIVAPIVQEHQSAAVAVAFELDLQPVVYSVVKHKQFGDTNEAHLVQASPTGEAEFITPLRFIEDAAFNKVIPKHQNLPANRSIELSEAQVFHAKDYRGITAIFAIEKIADTGWGLVTKVDEAEAHQTMKGVKKVILVLAAMGIMLMCAGWILFLRPIGHRLKSISLAAERIAAGDYQSPINDIREDEIGYIARSVDTLATALDDDIAKRAIVEDKLLHSATHDELTQLHNRKFAQEQIALLTVTNATDTHSILFLDLDGFKAINDTYGHSAGDEILIAISQRLKRALDENATLARWGGDEFVVILPNMHKNYAIKVADRITKLFHEKFKTSSGFHSLGCSIGIACSGEKTSLDVALQEADARMYREKQKRKNEGTTKIVSILGSALEESRVEVWYQPILALNENMDLDLIGAEVLARIRNPDGSIAAPGEFLFEAEGHTYGKALDEYVTRAALEKLRKWQEIGTVEDGFHLSLNLSEHAVNNQQFISNFMAMLIELNLSPEQLVIEIPQSTSFIDITQLSKLRKIGIKIALDDIGVHHSNLSRLAQLAPEIAKIDKSWLNDSKELENETAEVILTNLIRMCEELGSTVVIEGIENKEQVKKLKAFGVRHFQGYHLGKPLPAGSFALDWGTHEAAPHIGFKKAS